MSSHPNRLKWTGVQGLRDHGKRKFTVNTPIQKVNFVRFTNDNKNWSFGFLYRIKKPIYEVIILKSGIKTSSTFWNLHAMNDDTAARMTKILERRTKKVVTPSSSFLMKFKRDESNLKRFRVIRDGEESKRTFRLQYAKFLE
jgi:hypothetical protein